MKILQLLFLLFVAAWPCFAEDTVEEYFQSALSYLDKGEPKAAVIQLKNLLREAPFNGQARFLLGQTYLTLGDGASAVKELQKAQEFNIDKSELFIPLGRAYLMVGRPQKVLEQIRPDADFSIQNQATIWALRGVASLMAGDTEEAGKNFAESLRLDKSSGDGLRGAARLALVKQDFKEAIRLAKQALANDRKDIEAWLIVGETERVSGNFQAAIKAFDNVVALDAASIPGHLNRATAYIADGKIEKASADIQTVRDTAGDIPLVLYLEGVIAFDRKETKKAKDVLLQVLKLIPSHQPSRLLLGAIAYFEEEPKLAQSYLYSYVSNQPNNLPAVELLAATYMKLQRPADAAELLETVASQGHDDPQYLALLGSAYMQNKQFDKGTELLTEAIKLAPDIAAIRAQLAIGHIASGQMERAIGELENAVDLGQGLIQADVMLVLTLIQQKSYDQALVKARRLSQKMPDNPITENLLGTIYFAKGDNINAKKHWLDALKIESDYVSAMINIAKLEIKKGEYRSAEQWYQKVLEVQSTNLEALLSLARLAQLQNEPEKVVERLKLAQEKLPNAVEPALMRAEYSLSKGDSNAALDIVRKLKLSHPNNVLVARSLGLIQMKVGQVSSAITTIRELLAKDETEPEPHHLLAQALSQAGDTKAANLEWDIALKLSPNYLEAAAAKTQSAIKEGLYSDAIKLARKIQSKHENSSVGFQLEGDAHTALKDYAKANLAYQKGYQLEPNSYLARRVFQTYRQAGNKRKSYSGLEAWLTKNPTDANAWTLLGMARQEDGDVNKAISAYETAYKIHEENPIAVNNLAWLYQETGNERAVEMAEKLLTLAADNPEMTDTAGWVLLKNGQEDRALVLLQQAALKAPNQTAIRVHLAESLIKTHRIVEAERELNRLLKNNKDFPERLEAEILLNSLRNE